MNDVTDATDAFDTTVCIVGAGVSGLTCGTFTARAGLETLLVDGGESILRRNAHLENVPGFPAGVNARTFLDGSREAAADAGCRFVEGRAVATTEHEEGFTLELDDGRTVETRFLVAASWADAAYLPDAVETDQRGSKTYVTADEYGRTSLEGVFAAGRLAGKPHQTVVAAGHGAEVGLSVVEASEVPFYHDWVVPEGYFTDRDRPEPPGCEEIPAEEWSERERVARERMRALLAEPHPDDPTPHPSLAASDGTDER
ncbi:FAD-dependent oxidoreductase [Salinirubellus salinus]|uniref:FAD-dependent oxidoreductase n=1 Tax=Salinirubellus salinus TaxID=1364945 RepID=A0A9E7R4V1_9EURY|nr:FAD-dependent oxidoreductase [Salinirubellus salinus]UWM55597.1 FAD-dependent oxidoreductase [Salinirubellus salinus]